MPKDPTDVASDEQNCAGDQAGHNHCFDRHTVVSHGNSLSPLARRVAVVHVQHLIERRPTLAVGKDTTIGAREDSAARL